MARPCEHTKLTIGIHTPCSMEHQFLELNTGLNWFLSQVFPFIIKRGGGKWVSIRWPPPGFRMLAQSSLFHLILITISYYRYHYQNPWYDKHLTENNMLELLLFFNLTLYENKSFKTIRTIIIQATLESSKSVWLCWSPVFTLICLRYGIFNPLSQATE